MVQKLQRHDRCLKSPTWLSPINHSPIDQHDEGPWAKYEDESFPERTEQRAEMTPCSPGSPNGGSGSQLWSLSASCINLVAQVTRQKGLRAKSLACAASGVLQPGGRPQAKRSSSTGHRRHHHDTDSGSGVESDLAGDVRDDKHRGDTPLFKDSDEGTAESTLDQTQKGTVLRANPFVSSSDDCRSFRQIQHTLNIPLSTISSVWQAKKSEGAKGGYAKWSASIDNLFREHSLVHDRCLRVCA